MILHLTCINIINSHFGIQHSFEQISTHSHRRPHPD